jgi:PAS domain S-box-containing protein
MSRQELSDRILHGAQVLEELRRDGLGVSEAAERVAEEVAHLQDDVERLSRADLELSERQDELARTQARLDRELARMRRLGAWASLAWIVTHTNGRIAEVGAGASELFGLDADEMIGKPLADLVAPIDASRVASLVRRAVIDHDEPLSDVVAVHEEGWRVRVAPEHDAQGEMSGLLWLLEPPLAAEPAHEPQLADDTEFLSRLAHELRNPLAPVRAAVDLWREHGDTLTPEQRQWTVDVVGRQADHLARVVDDLLDVAELSRRDVSLRRSIVDLRDIVEDAQEAMHAQGTHHVHVELPDEPIRVEGDATRLHRVVVDLLDHALKSTPKDGSLFVVVDGDHEHAILLVRDEGTGPDLLDTAFGGEGEGPSPSDSPAGGPLQRLALVRRLVELHGGTVAVHDTPGGTGREVTVTLPRIVAANQDAPVPPLVPHDGERPLRVLVVDDNVDAAEMLALLLEARGLETTLAFDGQGAIAAFEWSRPDAVLLDLALPDMDGLDVARQLRAREPDVPLIAITGFGDEAMRKRTAKLGFAHHLTKPVDVTAVCRMLDDVSRRS